MSDYCVGHLIEQARFKLYGEIADCYQEDANCSCPGRLAGLLIVPINALAIVAHTLASVIDGILAIWGQLVTGEWCEVIKGLVIVPLFLVIQIPTALITGAVGLTYDIFAAMYAPKEWANSRSTYHRLVEMEYQYGLFDPWTTSVTDSLRLLNLAGQAPQG